MPKKKIVGTVLNSKLDKTITVEVTRLMEHPRYKKYVRVRKKYLVHDENNEAKTGDVVRIQEFRPISKRKRFVLDAIVSRGVGPEVELTEEAGIEEISRAMREKDEAERLAKRVKTSEERALTDENVPAQDTPSISEEVGARETDAQIGFKSEESPESMIPQGEKS